MGVMLSLDQPRLAQPRLDLPRGDPYTAERTSPDRHRADWPHAGRHHLGRHHADRRSDRTAKHARQVRPDGQIWPVLWPAVLRGDDPGTGSCLARLAKSVFTGLLDPEQATAGGAVGDPSAGILELPAPPAHPPGTGSQLPR